ncbi:General secretion pathway protein G [Chondromyces apiculatus DSM 436]|uniref:General secretion pathway protein G n=1 Tax=Chondromyces apiculatus DSM 436 TaxID=1192034 RepID=A0A017T7K2_9BACT|nr:General secretion pathway protein G [Chondromyces apiculatus DSM 436]
MSLVEVLIVVAIMAMISSGATYLVFPEYKKARIRSALIGASVIKMATEAYIELDMPVGAQACPTIDDLVEARKIDGARIDDPWGIPYEIECQDGDIFVISAGNDRNFDTADDIWSDFKHDDVRRLSQL